MAEVESIRNEFLHSEQENTPSPIVVHCRSGVGRTGVFVLADLMIGHLQNQIRQVRVTYSMLQSVRVIMRVRIELGQMCYIRVIIKVSINLGLLRTVKKTWTNCYIRVIVRKLVSSTCTHPC